MPRWQSDAVDFACESWAYQWVALFGREPRKASEYLGRIGSTLNLVRILQDGAGCGGTPVDRHFPEAFLGDGLLVNVVLKRMPESDREMIWRHYVQRWYILRGIPDAKRKTIIYEPVRLVRPVKQGVIAERMGISRAEYHQRRDTSKSFIRGALAADVCVDSKVRASDGTTVVHSAQVA